MLVSVSNEFTRIERIPFYLILFICEATLAATICLRTNATCEECSCLLYEIGAIVPLFVSYDRKIAMAKIPRDGQHTVAWKRFTGNGVNIHSFKHRGIIKTLSFIYLSTQVANVISIVALAPRVFRIIISRGSLSPFNNPHAESV
mgnify:CR=1 FL=1